MLCTEVTYNTTAVNATIADKSIKDKLDKMSRDGLERAGAECFLSVRRALCLEAYRKCNPQTVDLLPVCTSVKTSAVEVCVQALKSLDKNVIEASFDANAFSNATDCVHIAPPPPIVPVTAPANATATPPVVVLRTCSKNDTTPAYTDHCAANKTRTMSFKRVQDAVCLDKDNLLNQTYTLPCGIPLIKP
jgi:hypothetical protein